LARFFGIFLVSDGHHATNLDTLVRDFVHRSEIHPDLPRQSIARAAKHAATCADVQYLDDRVSHSIENLVVIPHDKRYPHVGIVCSISAVGLVTQLHDRCTDARRDVSRSCAYRKSHPDILMVESAQEDGVMGSLEGRRVAEGDWTRFWQAVILDLYFGGTAWWDSSCRAASLQAGIDARGTRGDFQRHYGTSTGASNRQIAWSLTLDGEPGNEPQWRLWSLPSRACG
jgi:hypothetical protein